MTQVYITTTNEQLTEFLKEDPLFFQQIKEKSYEVLLKKSVDYVSSRLNNEAQNTFEKLFERKKTQFFKKDNYGYTSGFSYDIEKMLSDKIESFFKESLEKNMEEYLNSDSFQSNLSYKIKEKMTEYILQMLDEQIKEEAKKLIS